jgi:transposase
MSRSVIGEDRSVSKLLLLCLDDYVAEGNPVRVVDAFVDELDLAELGFECVVAEATSGWVITRSH